MGQNWSSRHNLSKGIFHLSIRMGGTGEGFVTQKPLFLPSLSCCDVLSHQAEELHALGTELYHWSPFFTIPRRSAHLHAQGDSVFGKCVMRRDSVAPCQLTQEPKTPTPSQRAPRQFHKQKGWHVYF
eukprot:3656159-Amphidinium_carterae.2